MKNNIVYFIEKVSTNISTKLTDKAYGKDENIDILEQLGNLGYSKLSQKLSIIIYQNLLKNNTFNDDNSAFSGIKKLYKSIILNDNRYANALVCTARVLETASDLDNIQIYGIIDVISSLGDVCITGQKRGILKIIYMLGSKIEEITKGNIKIQEDKDLLRRTINKLFLKSRIKVADKLMDEFYIKQGRRKFTDPHMEDYFKKYLNSRYNFNIPVPFEEDPYGINVESKDLEVFLKNLNLEDLLIRELFKDVRIECEVNAEFYYEILNWSGKYFSKKKYTSELSEFLSQNVFYGETKKIRYKAIYYILENEGYLIDMGTVLNKLKSCDNIQEQIHIIKKNKEILYIRNNGMILQEYLLMNNDIQTLSILYKNKCVQIDTKDTNGEVLLIKACRSGRIDAIEFLLDIGVSIDARTRNGDTALMIACGENRLDIVKLLVERGANINAQGRCNQTALMYACEFKSKDIVEYLINNGADINTKTNHGSTALIYTFLTYAKNDKNNIEITKLLLESGADVNVRGEYGTALVYAVKYWNKDVVKMLLDHGANINVTDNKGENIFKIANRRKDKEILDVLSKHRLTTKLHMM